MLFALLLAGHLVGDFIAQTDRQAMEKTTSWAANQAHCLTYHLTMAAFVLPFYRSWHLLWALAVSWGTHAVIDRRWPVRHLLRATGSPQFAGTTFGVIAADQALHVAILVLIAVGLPMM
jgi:hypothetical protein